MDRAALGVILGVAFGVADVLLMLPLSFPDKRAALLGAFFARFALGFFSATVRLSVPPIAAGALIGMITSLPDAIITKAYAPIMGTGVSFGAIAEGVAVGDAFEAIATDVHRPHDPGVGKGVVLDHYTDS